MGSGYRRSGEVAPKFRYPTPREDGIRRAADLIKAGAPVGQVASVLEAAVSEYIRPLFERMAPGPKHTVTQALSVLTEAVKLAGGSVEPPPPVVRVLSAAEEFEDLVDRDAGRPARERRHRGQPFFSGGTADPKCNVCLWDPQDTSHATSPRAAAVAIRRSHKPNGMDED